MKALISRILTLSPDDRPSLHEIVEDDFFTKETVPGFIPTTAATVPPNFEPMSRVVSQANYARLVRNAGLGADQPVAPIAVPSAMSRSTSGGGVKSASNSLAQQEKDFHRAIQPGSPISALLSSARQPLLVANAGSVRESPLRKLTTAKTNKRDLRQINEEAAGVENAASIGGKPARVRPLDTERDSVENHKARIVQQMAPTEIVPSVASYDRENIIPTRREPKGKERAMPVIKELPSLPAPVKAEPVTGFEGAAATLSLAFDAKSRGKVFKDPKEIASHDEVFIVSWVDYCNKYGMGYALTDGSVGVHFNDSTTLVLSPDKQCVTFPL